MARKQRRRLGELLVKWGVVTQSAVDEALEHARGEGLRIGEALIALGLADEEDVTKALATQYDMEYIDLERNVLTVSAERRWARGDDDQMYVSERRQGTFKRQVHLGDSLDAEQIEAIFDDGVLPLRIPVAEKASPARSQ